MFCMGMILHAPALPSAMAQTVSSSELPSTSVVKPMIVETYDPKINPDNVNYMLNPQVWQFQEYGHHALTLYTGTLNLSIPVYTYKDPDFEIPISLDYASNGYKPNNQASSVGLGWFLNAGGYITRQNVGMRDDNNRHMAGRGFYYHFDKEAPLLAHDTMLYKYCKVNYSNRNLPFYYETLYDETTPDIHTFSFMGHYGKFTMGFTNKVHVYNTNHPKGEYAVDLTDYQSNYNDSWQRGSQIIITTGDGYTYQFTRDDVIAQYDIYMYEGNAMKYKNLAGPKNYWPLTKITAPNGRTVTFEYGEVEYNDNAHYDMLIYNPNSAYADLYTVREYVRQLKAIRIGDFVIDFQYGQRRPEKVRRIRDHGSIYLTPGELSSLKKLDKITVSNNQYTLKTCSLSYVYAPDEDNPVMFLQSVKLSGEGVYSMDYYDRVTKFPAHATTHFDHWGYYNNPSHATEQAPNRYEYGSATPVVTLDEGTNVETVISANREPNFYGARRGMLKSLVYPTGGYSKYYYESHSCNAMVTRDRTEGHKNLPYLKSLPLEKSVGGVRIKRITNYKNPLDSTYKEYSYRNGVLLHHPRYSEYQYVENEKVLASCPTNRVAYPADRIHIEYPYIQETLSDGSHTVYQFSTYRTVPDRPYDYLHIYSTLSNQIWQASDEQNLRAESHSMAGQRGKLLSCTTYNKYGAPVCVQENIYDYDRELAYHPTVKQTMNDWYVSRMYIDDYRLITCNKQTFSQKGYEIAMVRQNFTYNNRGQIVTTSTHGVKDSLTYMHNESFRFLNNDRVIRQIHLKNMVRLPHARYRMALIQGKYYITDVTKYTYFLFGDLPCISKIEKAQISAPTAIGSPLKFRTVAIYKYDNYGRMIFRNAAGSLTSYIWGYGGLYPVAEIEGIGLNDVQTITGLSDVLSVPLSGELSYQQEYLLRNLDNAAVTTYKYKPFIGVIELRDPSNKSTYYEYNANGKLTITRDNQMHLLNSYEYSSDNK